MASLSLRNIYKVYPNGFNAVKDFNLEIEDKEFIIFVVLSLGGLLLNQVMMYVFVDYMNVYYMLAKIVATAIVMIYNFISRKLILER